uniref:Uncharacterized protein n=1 Tax=Leersia perrieri TaxID=77586 RepID=A0A0D9XWJ6_9ORYZ
MSSSNSNSNSNNGAVLLAAAASSSQLAAGIDSDLWGARKTVAGNSGVVSVTFCIEALSSDNRSHGSTGFKDYGAITIDLLTANATTTKSKIDTLLGQNATEKKKQCLVSCQAAYAGCCKLSQASSPTCRATSSPMRYRRWRNRPAQCRNARMGLGRAM